MHIFLNAIACFHHHLAQIRAVNEFADDQERWRHDPLAHPDVSAMSARELADLPLGARACAVCGRKVQ